MEALLQQLRSRLTEVYDLRAASAVLQWDQTTYMPPGGAAARARQLATLARLSHERLLDPEIGRLLEALQPYEKDLPYDSDEAGLLRATRRVYERALRVPPAFVAELSAHYTLSYDVWTRARPAGDFPMVQPYLERTLDYSRRLAGFFPGYEHIADPLIDYADPDMKVSVIRPLFAQLQAELSPLVQAIRGRPQVDDRALFRSFPRIRQLDFAREVVRQIGYDFERGRQDLTPHPFTTAFSLGDVRITARAVENDLGQALFGSIHEAGHAIYEQGINRSFEGTPLGTGTSAGVHESQSRLWENIVGRSRPFWSFFYPRLQAIFPQQLSSVPLEAFYRAINTVRPSLIRTDADEVTYNLHVTLRFDLELEMLEGRLAVGDLAEAWRARYQADLGILPPDDRDGVLQDAHWFDGNIGGAFQGYTLGNILSGQFFQSALEAHPEIPSEMEQGRFGTLLGWLRERIYQHGSKFTAAELVERITGGPISIEPYVRYLREKYGEIYGI